VDGVQPVELQEPLEELARDPKHFVHDLQFPPVGKIRVYDDTLRDGEQMPGVAIAPKAKYELARLLHRKRERRGLPADGRVLRVVGERWGVDYVRRRHSASDGRFHRHRRYPDADRDGFGRSQG